jgi:protein-S-isoprenylcysteine O-methyltransferase Ste14
VAVVTPGDAGAAAWPASQAALADDRAAERRERLADFFARASLSALFMLLAVRIGRDFLETGHLTGLLLLVSELLVVALTVVRRRATIVDRSLGARIIATVSIVGIPFIRPTGGGLAPDLVTAAVSAAGLAIVITGKLTLGGCFGLMPAHRGIVCRGIYRVLRHPIYAGYLVTHAAFLVAHPTVWNLVLFLVSDTALLVRSMYEERTLAKDPEYAEYMTRVRWRVAPGIF